MKEGYRLKPAPFEGLSTYRPPLCHELAGQTFTLVMDDGCTQELHLTDRNTLTLTIREDQALADQPGKAPREAAAKEQHCYTYECLKADDTVYFINLTETDADTHTGRTYVLDLDTMLVTQARVTLGQNPRYPRMTSIHFTFGAIRKEDGSLNPLRHGYTADMVGKAVNWNYAQFEIVHVYSSERYYRVTFSEERMAQLRRQMPENMEPPKDMPVYEDDAVYIRLRDHLYLVSLSEYILCRRNGHGNNLLFVMNLDTLHDVGRSFGTNGDWQDENYTVGAFGELFDASETLAKESTYYIR